jgi:hypothetical protein
MMLMEASHDTGAPPHHLSMMIRMPFSLHPDVVRHVALRDILQCHQHWSILMG